MYPYSFFSVSSCSIMFEKIGVYQILTALAIWMSNSQNTLAQCTFHSPREMPPLPKNDLCNDSQTTCFFWNLAQLAISHIWAIFVLVHFRDASLGSLTNFTVLWSSFYHHCMTFLRTFSTLRSFYWKTAKWTLALPNSHISIESRHWSIQLVSTWKTDDFPSVFRDESSWDPFCSMQIFYSNSQHYLNINYYKLTSNTIWC